MVLVCKSGIWQPILVLLSKRSLHARIGVIRPRRAESIQDNFTGLALGEKENAKEIAPEPKMYLLRPPGQRHSDGVDARLALSVIPSTVAAASPRLISGTSMDRLWTLGKAGDSGAGGAELRRRDARCRGWQGSCRGGA